MKWIFKKENEMDDMPLISAKLFLLFLARIFIHL